MYICKVEPRKNAYHFETRIKDFCWRIASIWEVQKAKEKDPGDPGGQIG
jgi:hypothetical protein